MGSIGGDQAGEPGSGSTVPAPAAEVLDAVGPSGMRRLTTVELSATVHDLLGVQMTDAQLLLLPQDLRTPFDNDFTNQVASQFLVDGMELLAGELAESVLADDALRAQLVPCEPSDPGDAACFRAFVAGFGRRALRRPLADAEVERFMPLLDEAVAAGDFWLAVDSALRAFLQHTRFLYRVEVGTPVDGNPGVYRLSDAEMASRLSYLVWGSTPPPFVLDAVDAGELADVAGVRDATARLLDDERARARVSRFHAMWLGYESLPHDAELAAAMRAETDALLGRVIFDQRAPWTEVLGAEETFLTPALAEHYGLPVPSEVDGDWVPYGDSGRRGLLSHGTFLSAVPKFEDTSPTQRGLLIRTRLFCETISKPPPELMVNTDMPPGGIDASECKSVRYSMWQREGCKTCHAQMDPVGFGLENYDDAGRYREFEKDRPDCPIDGDGTLQGVGDFHGPTELADRMVESGRIDACMTKQLYRMAMGRFDLEAHDEALVDQLVAGSASGAELSLLGLITDLVGAEAFRFRREEETK